METVNSIALLSNHWSKVVHLTFDPTLVRKSFRTWLENPGQEDFRPDGIVMLFSFLRKVSDVENKYFPRMLWVAREERGSLGRYHIHVLMNSWLNPSVISSQWKYGISMTHDYRPEGNIINYISKCLGSDIEMSRFSGRKDLAVTWSKASIRLLNGLIRSSGMQLSRATALSA